MHSIHRAIGWAAIAFFGALAGLAHANGTFDSVKGQVQMTDSKGIEMAASKETAILPGSTITTGADSQAVLRFNDGSAVVLNQNTTFRVVDYEYDPAKPGVGRSVFDFLKGAARFVTGLIARAEPANYKLRTPQATIGVRGTDFSLASGSLYISVVHGVVTATNAAGTVAFGAGQFGFIGTAATLPAAIGAGQLPAGVAGSFTQLGVVPLPAGTLPPPAGGEAFGAGEATGAAGGASGATAAAIVGAGLGAAVLSNYKSSTTTTHH